MDIKYAFWKFLWLGNLIRHGIFWGFVGSPRDFGGVDFCYLSLEIREVTRNLSSMHSICTSPILILLVRLPPPRPNTILHKYSHQFLWRRLQYPGRMKSKDYVNFFLGAGGGGGGGGVGGQTRCIMGDVIRRYIVIFFCKK